MSTEDISMRVFKFKEKKSIKSFSLIKKQLTSDPCVQIPNLTKPFIVRTNASKEFMGADLLQEDDNNDRHVIEYFSYILYLLYILYNNYISSRTMVILFDRSKNYIRN